MPDWTYNPGSNEALDRGCTCAVLDNNHGKRPPYPPDGWWITGGCPVHDPAPDELDNRPDEDYRTNGSQGGADEVEAANHEVTSTQEDIAE